MFNNLHLVSNDSVYIAFHTESNRIFRLTKKSFEILSLFKKKYSISEVAQKTNLSETQITTFNNKIINSLISFKSKNQSLSLNYINRITLHVSNDCNLSCRYCYAHGGHYNQERKLMSIQKAREVIDFFLSSVDYIHNITFFGGEPLLNFKVVEYVCDYLEKKHNNKEIKFIPDFVLITNGTILNQEIINLIKKYNIHITVSIDGPEKINDKNRFYKNGTGSFRKIDNFIKTIKNKTNVEIGFEATYTKEHEILGYKQNDIINYMMTTYGISGTIIPEQDVNKKNGINDNINESLLFFNKMDKMFSAPFSDKTVFDHDVINALGYLANGHQKEMCQIGSKTIAVSVDGYIFPCHMNVGKKHLSLGNISGENIFTNPEKYKKMFPVVSLVKKEQEPCASCWARRLCGGCSLKAFYDYENDTFFTKPSEEFCRVQKKFIEELILNTAKLQADKKKWDVFVKRLKTPGYQIENCA